MKMLSFALVTAMSLTIIACGKKSGGGGGSDKYDSKLSTSYDTVKATYNPYQNSLHVGGQTYQLGGYAYGGVSQQLTQQSLNILTQAWNSKSPSLNMYNQNGVMVYRVKMSARVIRAYNPGYGYGYGYSGSNSQNVLDIRSASFVNKY